MSSKDVSDNSIIITKESTPARSGLTDGSNDSEFSDVEYVAEEVIGLNPEELTSAFLLEALPSKLTLRAIKEHATDFWRESSAKLEEYDLANCLRGHEVTPRHRAEIVNWMMKVLYVSNSKDKTFFNAVHIMDYFFDRTHK